MRPMYASQIWVLTERTSVKSAPFAMCGASASSALMHGPAEKERVRD